MRKTEYKVQKRFSAKDSAELYDYFSDESHIISSGMVRGLPSWVPWFVARDHDSKTEEGYYVYNTTKEERNAFPLIENCEKIILKYDDMRHVQQGFRCFVIFPEGVAIPDYDAFEVEWQLYLEKLSQEKEQKPKRKKREQKIKKTKEEKTPQLSGAGHDPPHETQAHEGQTGTSDEGQAQVLEKRRTIVNFEVISYHEQNLSSYFNSF